MALLESDEANIIDAEAPNWRLIVYPILAVLVVVVGGFGYYYYQQNQRVETETAARAALVKATTPEEYLKVADQYPGTDQATLALLHAGDAALTKSDYTGALAAYRKVTENPAIDPVLHDSAELGAAAALEGSGSTDKAIIAFQDVAQRREKSPYAPYAYHCLARIYEQNGDKDNERQVLNAAAGLDADSPFTKQAQFKLKELTPAAQAPITVNAPTTPAPAPAAPVPTPVAPAK
jgi:predicted negative regulator of RcsB-dependent stress response